MRLRLRKVNPRGADAKLSKHQRRVLEITARRYVRGEEPACASVHDVLVECYGWKPLTELGYVEEYGPREDRSAAVRTLNRLAARGLVELYHSPSPRGPRLLAYALTDRGYSVALAEIDET